MPIADAEQAYAKHRNFQEHFRKGQCFACGAGLDFFDPSQPCIHWYLHPVGFTKRHVPEVAERFGLFQTQMFMRWVANESDKGRHINDLKDEGQGRLIELTIRYGDFEWSLSCSDSDFQGHAGASPEASAPHYHLQFRRKKQSFVKFNDFHLPLHPEDIDTIHRLKENPNATVRFAGGESMGDLFASVDPEVLIKGGVASYNEDEAPLSLQTIVMADKGTEISGDALADLFDRAKREGVTVTSLLHELSDVSVQTIISPGKGVVEQATRKGGRGRSTRD